MAIEQRGAEMQRVALILILLFVTTGSPVSAQPATAPSLGIPAAPVGHRQPTADSVPKNTYKDPNAKKNAKQDAILDKKMKGICRGC